MSYIFRLQYLNDLFHENSYAIFKPKKADLKTDTLLVKGLFYNKNTKAKTWKFLNSFLLFIFKVYNF
jgi:hypothetical protein